MCIRDSIAIFRIFKMAAAAILDFWNSEILLAIVAERVETHQHAKLCQNRSISCEDIKIFSFFNMAAAAILDCGVHKILLADRVWRAQTHHCTKLHQNPSFHCGDIAILQIFKMAATAILNSWNFIGCCGREGPDASACQISSKSVASLQRYCDFSNFQDGRRRHLGFLKSRNFIGC